MTTTSDRWAPTPNITHRHACTLPGYHVEHSRTIPGVRITRCTGCDAVTLTKKGTPR